MSDLLASMFGISTTIKSSINDDLPFREKYTFEQRRKEYEKIAPKFENKIPVIVQRSGTDTDIPQIDRHKFMVPSDVTISQFAHVIRKRIKLKPDYALFFFVNNTMPSMSSPMSQIYKEYHDKDGFLYINYSGESTFGY